MAQNGSRLTHFLKEVYCESLLNSFYDFVTIKIMSMVNHQFPKLRVETQLERPLFCRNLKRTNDVGLQFFWVDIVDVTLTGCEF